SMIDKEARAVRVNPDDELQKATMLTHGGKVVHPAFAAAAAEPDVAGPVAAGAAKPAAAGVPTEAASSAPKRRGRPPKHRPVDDGAPAIAATASGGEATPKRRGRPPKSKSGGEA